MPSNHILVAESDKGTAMEIEVRNLLILSQVKINALENSSQSLLHLRSTFKNKLEGRIAIILYDKIRQIHEKIEYFIRDCKILGIPCPFMLIISNNPVDLSCINYPSPLDFTLVKELSSNEDVLTAIHRKFNEENGYFDQINSLQLICQESKPENPNTVSMRMK